MTTISEKLNYFAERKGYFYDWQPMQYYFNESDSVIMPNFLHRWKFSESFKENSSVFSYWYLRDTDTLEYISHFMYDSIYHFWIIMLYNDMDNPWFSFPLNDKDLHNYIVKKYGDEHLRDVHHYETIEDEITKTPKGIIVDEWSKKKRIEVTNYDYEVTLNDKKRYIRLIHKQYIEDILKERDKIISLNFQNTRYKQNNYIFV